jgi:hypothetical protein
MSRPPCPRPALSPPDAALPASACKTHSRIMPAAIERSHARAPGDQRGDDSGDQAHVAQGDVQRAPPGASSAGKTIAERATGGT